MLIEFSVSNFRSFRERQTLSMVAAPRLSREECLFAPDVDGEKLPDLLKVAAIYGPNASGKSSLLMAMNVLQTISRKQAASEKVMLPVSPFRFDEKLLLEPSRFEIHFIQNRQRFQFELAATSERIIEERLIAYPKGTETLLYERKYIDGKEVYKIGKKLEGGVALHTAWKNLTGPQVLFLSQAVANSSESINQLRSPLKWLQAEFSVIEESDMQGWARTLRAYGANQPAIGEVVSSYLSDVDIPVTKIAFDDESPDPIPPINSSDPKAKEEMIKQILAPGRKYKTTLTHTTALGSADFDFSEESRGTKNLMGFFMPWTILEKHVVAVDELDSSLHPKIVAELVRKFLFSSSGKGQLIFTTHDTHLMDAKLLRRDQFWVTERNSYGATRLRSLHDFKGREGEDIEKRYYEGRYRALPVLPSDAPKESIDKKER